VIAQQIAELNRGILNIKIDLKEYEESYDMMSDSFYERYSQGDLDDREDFMLWSGLYEMLLENEMRLQDLA